MDLPDLEARPSYYLFHLWTIPLRACVKESESSGSVSEEWPTTTSSKHPNTEQIFKLAGFTKIGWYEGWHGNRRIDIWIELWKWVFQGGTNTRGNRRFNQWINDEKAALFIAERHTSRYSSRKLTSWLSTSRICRNITVAWRKRLHQE